MSAYNYKSSKHSNPFRDLQYDTLFSELYTPLCQFCMQFVHRHDAAEDIVQDQFIYLWQHWERLSGIESINAYLYRAVKNKSINFLIKSAKNQFNIDLSGVMETHLASQQPSPHILLEQADLEKLIENALAQLPDRCRTIFTLKRFAEMSNQEIAESLNISVKTVEAQTTIALKKLKQYIKLNWENEPQFIIATLLLL